MAATTEAPEAGPEACPWEPIDGFRSWIEFEAFGTWLAAAIARGSAREVEWPPAARDRGMIITRYVEHVASGELWELCRPDAPCAGHFGRVGED